MAVFIIYRIIYVFTFFNFIVFFNFTILFWFCHISTWIHHRYTLVPHPEPSSLLPPRTILLGQPSALAPSIQYHTLNLDLQLVSYMILYMVTLMYRTVFWTLWERERVGCLYFFYASFIILYYPPPEYTFVICCLQDFGIRSPN